MSGLFPLSRMQQFDENGRLLAGARLFLFTGGTTTPISGYKDASLSTAWPNPILADDAGRLPLIYLADGFYRQRLTDKNGDLIFDDDGIPVITSSAGGAGTTVDPDGLFKTRDVKIRFDDQPLSGYVRMNGQSIGSATSGATERANADTQSLYTELWSFANITVAAGKGATAVADFAANKPLTLPDVAGRGLFGSDDLGAGAKSRLTTVTSGTLPGATGGAETLAISQANLPAVNFTGAGLAYSATTGNNNASHTHTQQGTLTTGLPSNDHVHGGVVTGGTTVAVNGSGSNANPIGTLTTGNSGGESTGHTHSVTLTGSTSTESSTHQHAVSGTTATQTVSSGGSGTAYNKLPPLVTFMIYVRL